MKVGCIGAGRMTQRRLQNLPDGCVPVAVYDHDHRSPRLSADLTGLRVSTPDEVIARSDWVIVATPHAFLAGYARQAEEAGRRVFIEKPGATRPSELDGVDARVGYNHRFWPGILAAKQQMTGPVLHIRAAYGHPGRPGYASEWRMDPTLSGGGELIDQGSHLIDLTRFVAGTATLGAARLTTERWEAPVEDNAYFWLDLEHGTAWLHASWTEPHIFRFEIITTAERLVVDGFPWQRQTLTVHREDHEPVVRAWQADHSLYDELCDALRDGPVGATTADAQAVLTVIDKAYR